MEITLNQAFHDQVPSWSYRSYRRRDHRHWPTAIDSILLVGKTIDPRSLQSQPLLDRHLTSEMT